MIQSSVFHRKVFRTIRANKSGYIGSVFLITLSCLMYSLFGQLAVTMNDAVKQFESDYAQEDASFQLAAPLSVQQRTELTEVHKLIIEQGAMIDIPVTFNEATSTLRVFRATELVNRVAVLDGKEVTSGGIGVDPAFAKAHNVRIGDSISVGGVKFTVQATIALPHYIYPLKKESDLLNDANQFGLAVLSATDYSRVTTRSSGGTSYYSVKAKETLNDSAQTLLLTQLKQQLVQDGHHIMRWTETRSNPRTTIVTTKLNNITMMSDTLPLVILILSTVLTAVVIARLLRKETRQIGTLYALGYHRSEIRNHYLWFPLIIAISGSWIGTIAGVILLNPMVDYMLSYFNIPVETMNMQWNTILISLFIPIGLLLTSTSILIQRTLRLTPLKLLHGEGGTSTPVSKLERWVNLNRFPLNFRTKFQIREQLRSVPRSMFVIFGVGLASMLLLLGFTLNSSINSLLKSTTHSSIEYKYDYQFNSFQTTYDASLPNDQAEPYSYAPFGTKKNDKRVIVVYGIELHSNIVKLKSTQTGPWNLDSVMISSALATRLNVEPGSTMWLVNQLDGRKYSFVVSGIYDSVTNEGVYMPRESLNALLRYPQQSYLGIWSRVPLPIIETSSDLRTVTTSDEVSKALRLLTAPISTSMAMIGVASFALGLIVLVVVSHLIIDENRRTIVLLSVLGYRRNEVRSLLLNSSTILVIIGYVISVSLLFISLDALFDSMSEQTGLIIPVIIEIRMIIFGFMIMLVIFELSKWLNRHKLNDSSVHAIQYTE